MTSNGDRMESRLDALEGRMERVEQSLERTSSMLELLVQSQSRTQQQVDATATNLSRIEKIAESNSRSIEALGGTVTEDRADREEIESELRVDLRAVQATIEQNAELQRTLLTVQLEDRETWRQQREEWRQQQQETDRQIQALIDLSRQNTQAHTEFRSDIRHLWERMDG